MQLTSRQREFARIAGWALPISVALGAVFGHFQAQTGSVWGYIQGAVTAIVISCTILPLEFAVFSRTRSALARRMAFLRVSRAAFVGLSCRVPSGSRCQRRLLGNPPRASP